MPLVKPVAIFCLQYKKFFPRVLHLNFKKDIDGAYFIRGLVANRQQKKAIRKNDRTPRPSKNTFSKNDAYSSPSPQKKEQSLGKRIFKKACPKKDAYPNRKKNEN